MKYPFNKKYIFYSLSTLFALCGAILFYYIIFNGPDFMSGFRKVIGISMPIIDGFVIAYLLAPLLDTIENAIIFPICKKLKFNQDSPKVKKTSRGISLFFTMSFFIFCIYILLKLLIPQLISSITSLVYSFPYYIDNLDAWLSQVLKDNPDIEKMTSEYLDEYATSVQGWLKSDVLPTINKLLTTLSSHVLNIVKSLWNLVLGLIISMYMLGSKEHFGAQAKKLLYAFLSERRANRILYEFRAIDKTFGGFIVGKIIDSIIIGIICFVGMGLIKLPYATLISVIVGVTNIIPFFGPYIGAIPSALLILMVNPKQCLYFIIFIIILQQIDGNIIGPRILGDSTGLSGFWVIFSITIFGGFFGVLGMFIGVPVMAVIYSGIKRYSVRRLRAKHLPESTTAYMHLSRIKHGVIEIAEDEKSHTDDSTVDGAVKIRITIDEKLQEELSEAVAEAHTEAEDSNE